MLISGTAVMVAMAGLFLTGDADFASFGMATMIVVAMAMLGSLTVLPALLSKLGDRVDRLHVPLVGRLRRDDGEGRLGAADRPRTAPSAALGSSPAARAGGTAPSQRSRSIWQPQALTRSRSRSPWSDVDPRMQQAFPERAAGKRRRQGA